jgi:hypothetical protein
MRLNRASNLVASAVTLLILCVTPGGAQELSWSGQVRPRFEFRDPVGDGTSEAFTSMRTRLALMIRAEGGLSIFIQPQDVRVWGGESHPLFDYSADGFDLHQGYLRLNPESASWLTATIGRAESNLGGQRLIGSVDWVAQGQSFDGVRLEAEAGRTQWTVLAFQINDAVDPDITQDQTLFGVYTTVRDVGPGALDVYWLNDRLSSTDNSEHLLGGRYVLPGAVTGRAEATIARGTRSGDDVAAYMLGVRVGTRFAEDRLSATLWYDYLSGDDPGTPETEVFNTLFATNHKFYGFADLFLNIPANTGGAGLQDLAAKLGWTFSDRTNASMDIHTFRAASAASLTSSHFGEEIDLSVGHRYSAQLAGSIGFSQVFQAAGLEEIGRLDGNMTWLYVMLNATF